MAVSSEDTLQPTEVASTLVDVLGRCSAPQVQAALCETLCIFSEMPSGGAAVAVALRAALLLPARILVHVAVLVLVVALVAAVALALHLYRSGGFNHSYCEL